MKFVRHFFAAVLVVAVICGIALVAGHWGRGPTGPGQFVPGPGGKSGAVRFFPGKGGPPPGFNFGRFRSGSDGLHLSNVSDLIQTVIIGSGIAALVIALDRAAWGRRHRRS